MELSIFYTGGEIHINLSPWVLIGIQYMLGAYMVVLAYRIFRGGK